MQFHDFVMVNNEKSGIEMKMIIGSGLGYDRGAMIKGGIIVGHSTISPPSFETRHAMVNISCFVFQFLQHTYFGLHF